MSHERALRRFLVVANYLAITALVVNYGLVERGSGSHRLYEATLLVFLCVLLSRTPLFGFIFQATGILSANLDERQQAQRNRIYALSYQTLVVLAFLCLVGWMFLLKYPVAWFMPGINQPPWTAYADQVFVFLLFVIDTVLFLPVALVAWLEPDPITEDFAPSRNKERNHELT